MTWLGARSRDLTGTGTDGQLHSARLHVELGPHHVGGGGVSLGGQTAEEDAQFGAGADGLALTGGDLGERLDARQDAVPGQQQLDDAAGRPGGGVDDHRAGLRHGRARRFDRPGAQALGDGGRLGEAVEHGEGDVIDRAGADRVVGGVPDHRAPGQGELGAGPLVGRQPERAERFGLALEALLGAAGRLVDIDAVGCHSHEQVGPGPAAQLAVPGRQPSGGRRGDVVGDGGDLEAERVLDGVGLGHDPAEPGLGHLMVGAVHQQQGSVPIGEQGAELDLVGGNPPHQRLGVLRQGGPVAVPDREVLGPDPRSVGRLPPEGGAVHRRGNAPPHHRVGEAGLPQDLRHLGDMAEHVGEVADGHGAAEAGGPFEAELEVPDDRFGRDQELVHQDVPRAHGQPAGGGQPDDQGAGFGPHLQVVVDDRHLAVEQEMGIGRIRVELRKERVQEFDEAEAEGLEGLVPLPVPVHVGHDRHPAKMPAGGGDVVIGCRHRTAFVSAGVQPIR